MGAAARCGSVTVVPVFATSELGRADYELGAEAIAAGTLELRELASGGAVDRIEARNRARRRALVVDGEHLIGARQNRMVTSSAVIGGGSDVRLPVSCVEQGRWTSRSDRFTSHATAASPSLRRIARLSVTRGLLRTGGRDANQAQIWTQIANQQRSLRVGSDTAALAHSFAARASDIADAATQLPYIDGAVGLAIGLGAQLVSVDVFDSPLTCAHYWPRLIQSAALDGLGAARADGIDAAAVGRLLDELGAARWSAVPAIGDGEELRAETDTAAVALLRLDGQLVHLGAAAGSGPVAALESREMQRDLPKPLVDRYRIVSRIGVGGTKEVFRASDLQGGPDVAIARIPMVDEALFAAEIDLARRAHSEHVPQIFDACIDCHGDGYLVMERCEGTNLAELVSRGPLPVAEAGRILVAFARGLCAIHGAEVLHRDVKLENAIVCAGNDGPKLKIIDFGLSQRAWSSSTAVFTPAELSGTAPYMAREVIKGEAVDARSDVYAFGVCCFRVLTGELPTPPRANESSFDYLQRLANASSDVDDAELPPELPDGVHDLVMRMLDPQRDRRPFMPEVIRVLEQAFAIAASTPPAPRPPVRRPLLERVTEIPLVGADHVAVTGCPHAPIIAIALDARGGATQVRAVGSDRSTRWVRQLDGWLSTVVRADLDGDGVREIYLAGGERVVALDAAGTVRFTRQLERHSAQPSLLALPDPVEPRLAIDGVLVDIWTGQDRGVMASIYRGDGHRLVNAHDRSGAAYNGFARQGFCGDHRTAAAIICQPGDSRFAVAHLEETRSGRIELAIYGPGGARLHALPVAECRLDTGDTRAISAVYQRTAPLFGPRDAPLALLGPRGTAVVIAPLLAPEDALRPTLVAFALPTGRELWRWNTGSSRGSALLADVRGVGRPELVVGTGSSLVVHDAWTGRASEPLACTGAPIAFGDPFATGFAHVITASRDGLELWRGPRCVPGAMAWTGARGDLWRTGTLRSDGRPLGPV